MLVVESASNADVIRVAQLAARNLPELVDPGDLVAKLQRGRASFLVAREITTNDVVGFCVAENEHAEGHVVAFAIEKARRGQGIGTALMRQLRRDLAQSGAHRMHLEVRWDDPNAQNFYRRHGFRPAGLQEGAYSDGGAALILERPL